MLHRRKLEVIGEEENIYEKNNNINQNTVENSFLLTYIE